jgi:hypothetical protein
MDAYFYNTETKKRYTIKYVTATYIDSAVNVTYQAANIPQSSENRLYWTKTEKTQTNIIIYSEGEKILEDVALLKSFCIPEKGKKAPSVIQFKLVNLPVQSVVFTNVSVEYDLFRIKKDKLDRCKITIQFIEYGSDSLPSASNNERRPAN